MVKKYPEVDRNTLQRTRWELILTNFIPKIDLLFYGSKNRNLNFKKQQIVICMDRFFKEPTKMTWNEFYFFKA